MVETRHRLLSWRLTTAEITYHLPDYPDLAHPDGPAVVNIRTTERARAVRGPGGGDIDEDMLELLTAEPAGSAACGLALRG